MKFSIFSIWEIIHKTIIRLIVIGITIGSIVCYFKYNEDSAVSFVISVVYALLLFEIGTYSNYMDKSINEKFYDRKDYYLVLLRLKSVIKTIKLEDYTDEDVFQSIIKFKIFTNRADEMEDVSPLVAEHGFEFEYRKLDIEEKFIEKRNNLLNKLQNNIMSYIDKNSIIKKVPYPRIPSIFFDVEVWCKESCELNEVELKDMKIYIYSVFSELESELREFKEIMKKVIKIYHSIKNKVEWNVKMIEHVYGRRLEYELNKEEQYINKLELIIHLIEKLNNTMASYEEVEDMTKNTNDNIEYLYEEIKLIECNLAEKIDEAKDDLINNY